VAHCHIEVNADHGIDIMTDRAIPIALIANELITNAAKYAYQGEPGGNIWVRLALVENGTIALLVRDEGAGLPTDFDPRSATGLGMRIVRALSQQLGAEIAIRRLNPGTELVVSIPRDAKA
jgi:two-component sensor histidine kinase